VLLQNDLRGAAIAEGDTLVICIRKFVTKLRYFALLSSRLTGFAMELLLGRLEAPPTSNPESLLYRHEQSLVSNLRAMLSASGHRNPTTEAILLPQCQGLMEAIGHRMAYDAAVEEGLDRHLIDTYVSHVISVDPSWYSEEAGISRAQQKKREFESVTASFQHLESLLERLDVDSYVTAPMVSDERWNTYERSLETYTHPEKPILDTPWIQSSPSALLNEHQPLFPRL
jgi:acyl-CoA oxidase